MIINRFKTQAEIDTEIVSKFVEYLNNVVTGTEKRVQTLFEQFWANADVINEAIGTETGKLFTLLGSLEALLEGYDPDYTKCVVPIEFTMNEDGTVTLGDLPEVVEEEQVVE